MSTSSDGPNGSPSGDGTGPLFIARWDQETATAWRGRLALIAFYDYGLSDSQHGAHLAAATNIVDYSAAVMTDSPVAFWRMQDATGDLADYTGNGHTAVLDAGSPLYQQEGPFTGARSVITDGSAGWKVPDDPAWSATEFTIEAWVWAGPPDPAPVRRGRRGLGLVRGPRSAL